MSTYKPLHKASYDDLHRLTIELQLLEEKAHKIGLHATARRLNRATQVVGYEFAGDFKAITDLTTKDPL